MILIHHSIFGEGFRVLGFFLAIPLDVSIRMSLENLGVEFQKKSGKKPFDNLSIACSTSAISNVFFLNKCFFCKT